MYAVLDSLSETSNLCNEFAAYDANPTKAQLTVLGKEAVNTNNVNVLLSNYGSGYTPYVAKACKDLGRVVLGPGCIFSVACVICGFWYLGALTLRQLP